MVWPVEAHFLHGHLSRSRLINLSLDLKKAEWLLPSVSLLLVSCRVRQSALLELLYLGIQIGKDLLASCALCISRHPEAAVQILFRSDVVVVQVLFDGVHLLVSGAGGVLACVDKAR